MEFKDHGLGDMITIQCRDVCKDGFDMENAVTAGNKLGKESVFAIDLRMLTHWIRVRIQCSWICHHHGKPFHRPKRPSGKSESEDYVRSVHALSKSSKPAPLSKSKDLLVSTLLSANAFNNPY